MPTVYPVCTFDLEALDTVAVGTFGLNKTGQLPTPKFPTANLSDGDLFYGGQMGYQIFHEALPWKPVPAHGWVEVTHTTLPTELMSYWAWRQKGSGVWFNVGKTMTFPSPADPQKTHAAAIAFLTANCSAKVSPHWPQMESDIFGQCAREKGFDSIQFEPTAGSKPWGSFGLAGLVELVLVNLDGDKVCGVAAPSKTLLRGGWLANRTCECENAPMAPHCGITGINCATMPGGSCMPRLCETWPCQFAHPPCRDTWCSKRLRAEEHDDANEANRQLMMMSHRSRARAAATMA